MSVIYYFGRWGGPGHYLRGPAGGMLPHSVLPPQILKRLDSGFCPSPYPGSDRLDLETHEVQGDARLHHVEGWTVLAFWDRSADTRPGSHSTYLAQGTHDAEAMLALARDAFPDVWARYRFRVRVRVQGGAGAGQGGA